MIVAISGAVGSGKSSVAKALGEKVGADVWHLNERALEYKLEDDSKMQTFDFDVGFLIEDLEREILEWKEKSDGGKVLIVESHFAHLLSSDVCDLCVVLNRDLSELSREYEKRDYVLEKREENLEVEALNLCFYEALEEGWPEGKIFCVENDGDLGSVVRRVERLIGNFK